MSCSLTWTQIWKAELDKCLRLTSECSVCACSRSSRWLGAVCGVLWSGRRMGSLEETCQQQMWRYCKGPREGKTKKQETGLSWEKTKIKRIWLDEELCREMIVSCWIMDCSALKVGCNMRWKFYFSSPVSDFHSHTCWHYKHSGTNCWLCLCPQCSLHIHAAYSTAMRLNVPMLPLSEPNAVGLILAHGNFQSTAFFPQICQQSFVWDILTYQDKRILSGSVGDAISVMRPDVYVSDDGGYTWIKALDGPHHYAILDSGGLLVAVEHNANQPVSQIK